MRSDTKECVGQMGCVVLFATLFAFAGRTLDSNAKEEGAREAREQFEIEAVQHGAARWIVDDEGRREFVWNESGSED